MLPRPANRNLFRRTILRWVHPLAGWMLAAAVSLLGPHIVSDAFALVDRTQNKHFNNRTHRQISFHPNRFGRVQSFQQASASLKCVHNFRGVFTCSAAAAAACSCLCPACRKVDFEHNSRTAPHSRYTTRT